MIAVQLILDIVIVIFFVLYYFKLRHIDLRFKEYDLVLKFYKGIGGDYKVWKSELKEEYDNLKQNHNAVIEKYKKLEKKLQKKDLDKDEYREIVGDILYIYGYTVATTDVLFILLKKIAETPDKDVRLELMRQTSEFFHKCESSFLELRSRGERLIGILDNMDKT